MPLVEIIHASKQPASRDQKRALAQEMTEIFRDVLETPDGRLRVFFQELDYENCLPGMLEEDSEED